MKNRTFLFSTIIYFLLQSFCVASLPVAFSGKIALDGINFHGPAHFAFSIVDKDGVEYWRHAEENNATIENFVHNGRYLVLLGGQGMLPLLPELFLQQEGLLVRVSVDLLDGMGMRLLQSDQSITATPYSLVSDLARRAEYASVASAVSPHGITHVMLSPELLADLNDSASRGSITPNELNEQILKYFRPEIIQPPVLLNTREHVYTGQSITLSSDAVGKFLSYQWTKDGVLITGATSRELTITDTNGSLHNGNYSIQVSNDFGSISSTGLQVDVNETLLIHKIDLNSSVCMEMIWVEPGRFLMGSPEYEAGRNTNETQHEVSLTKGFYLGKYEVTQAQYEVVMSQNTAGLSATPSNWPNHPNRPVEMVSWEDIQVFLTLLNTREAGNIPLGWAYMLPTEAEWEYACRAGRNTAYSWGDTISSEDANYNNSILQTSRVGQYRANRWGFFDMHGNVWEWTADWYGAYGRVAKENPAGPVSGSYRVYRGGSWTYGGTSLRSATRSVKNPNSHAHGIGFRIGLRKE